MPPAGYPTSVEFAPMRDKISMYNVDIRDLRGFDTFNVMKISRDYSFNTSVFSHMNFNLVFDYFVILTYLLSIYDHCIGSGLMCTTYLYYHDRVAVRTVPLYIT
jgi:hypothetical protein